MNVRAVLLALLLAPLLIFGVQLARRQSGAEQLLPGLDPDAVARIELARGREQVVLGRRQDTGAWEVLSAADAPGNAARITATLDKLAGLKGRTVPEGTPLQRREPLEIRLAGTPLAVPGLPVWAGLGTLSMLAVIVLARPVEIVGLVGAVAVSAALYLAVTRLRPR